MRFQYFIPVKVREFLLRVHHKIVWRFSIKKFRFQIDNNIDVQTELLHRLVYGWGNQGFSAQVNYLQTCIRYGLSTKLPIMECGSGLTTILLAIIANKTGSKLMSIENSPEWAKKVDRVIKKMNLKSVDLHITPIKEYVKFSWYDISSLDLTKKFKLIICDGPPAQTKGGRYGLVPIMLDFFNENTIILMDDTHRLEERKIIESWKKLIQFTEEYIEEGDRHAILKVSSYLSEGNKVSFKGEDLG